MKNEGLPGTLEDPSSTLIVEKMLGNPEPKGEGTESPQASKEEE